MSVNITRNTKSTRKLVVKYEANKAVKVGETIKCCCCGTSFVKKQYSQAFCKTKCKDKFWNTVDKKKYNNITRISPANASYKANVILPLMAIDLGYPSLYDMLNSNVSETELGWGDHGCYVEPCEWCGLRAEYCGC